MLQDAREDKLDTPNTPKPGSNKTPLDASEAEKIKKIATRIREGTEELEQEAYDLRLQYLQADGEKFTKYAAAGEAMQRAVVKNYANRMPRGVTARYEVSLLKDDEIKMGLENRFTRSAIDAERTAPKKPMPVIRVDSTAKEIRNWRKKWRHPKAEQQKSSDKLTLDEIAEIGERIAAALEPFKGYEIAGEIENLVRLHRKRLERAEAKAAKKKEQEREWVNDIRYVCFWRHFSSAVAVEPKPKLRTRDLRRFLDAIEALKSHPELRVRFFDDARLRITVEHYDPRWVWDAEVSPSAHYLESVADGVIREGSAGYVIQTCDYGCEKRDAARHVPGLKKGVIVLPSKVEEMQSWYSDLIKRSHPRLRHREEFLAELRNRGELITVGEPTDDSK